MSNGQETQEVPWRQWKSKKAFVDLKAWIRGGVGLAGFVKRVIGGWNDKSAAEYDKTHGTGAGFELWFIHSMREIKALAKLSGPTINSWEDDDDIDYFCYMEKTPLAYHALRAYVMELPGHPLDPSTRQGGCSGSQGAKKAVDDWIEGVQKDLERSALPRDQRVLTKSLFVLFQSAGV